MSADSVDHQPDTVLRTVDLRRQFGSLTAVDGVDFSIERGELRGLIGPNGAGKTTFFNLLSGLLRPTSGEIWLQNDRITRLPPYERAHRGLAQSMQVESLFPSLTVIENVIGGLGGTEPIGNPLAPYDRDPEVRNRALEILDRVGLADRAEFGVADLSHGDQKLLEIALALSTDPDVLLLDEPTAGLSAEETQAITALIDDLHGELSMVLVEHDVEMVLEHVDAVTVLHAGQVIAEGPPAEIEANETVQRVYMGRQ